jgi:hypothetical protein
MIHDDRSHKDEAASARRDMARRFNQLAAEWREDTEFDSALTTIYRHPAFWRSSAGVLRFCR